MPRSKRTTSESSRRRAKKSAAMPGIIYAEGALPDRTENTQEISQNEQKETETQWREWTNRGYNPRARQLMVFGVTVFTLIITGLWGIALYGDLSGISWRASPEGQLATTAKTNWDTIFTETKKDMAAIRDVQQSLIHLLAESAATAATTNTTSTSSTTISTTTP